MKTIVTHLSPDLDAATSVWLIKRYLPQWENAQVVFVESRSLWNNIPVDSDAHVIYVDTGLGKFDHHQTNEYTCAAKRVFYDLAEKGNIPQKYKSGLERLIGLVTDLDHFSEVTFPEPNADRYDLSLHQLVSNLKYSVGSDTKVIDAMMPLLDSAQILFTNKVNAEEEIKSGFEFQSYWGKSLVVITDNKEVMRLAQKMGFTFVATKTKEKGYIRIKIPPHVTTTLDNLYEKIIKIDTKAYWYYHISKHMLLNDPTQKPDCAPSSISASQLIALIKSV